MKTLKGYENDYSFERNSDSIADMVLSGKYLAKRNLKINIGEIKIDEYPSEERLEYLKRLLAEKYNKNVKHFVLGAASNGIIQNLVKLFFSKGGTLLVSEFSFPQPEYAVNRIGGTVKKIATENFKINFNNFIKEINEDTKAIFLCNPNNPTGYYYNPEEIIDFEKMVKNIPVIVSEAAVEFACKSSLLNFDLPENIIVTRTFSKAYGLAGLRVGFGYLSGKYLEIYQKNITRFEVSILSIEVAIQMLEANDINQNINLVLKERNYLQHELDKLGIKTLKSDSNAFMSEKKYELSFYELLNEKGVSVAKVDSDQEGYFYFRVAVQEHKVNKIFIERLKEIGSKNIKMFER